MSVWIEIQCDVRSGEPLPGRFDARCYTYRNDNVMGMAKNTTHALRVMATLTRRAVAEGWNVSRGQWTCPGCQQP